MRRLSDSAQAVVDQTWLTVSEALGHDLVAIRCSTPSSVQACHLTPFNLSTGQYITGISALLLRAKVIQHFQKTGVWDNRFVGHSLAHDLGLSKPTPSEQCYVLCYALDECVDSIDSESGAVETKYVRMDKPFRAFQTVYHLPTFEAYPNMPKWEASELPTPPLTTNDLVNFVSTLVQNLGVDVQFHESPSTSFDGEDKSILVPHPDLFRDPLAFYRVTLCELMKLLPSIVPIPAVDEFVKALSENELTILSELTVDFLFVALCLPNTSSVACSVQANTLTSLSKQPTTLLEYVFYAEQLSNLAMMKSGIAHMFLQNKEVVCYQSRKSNENKINEFLERLAKEREAKLQASEGSSINF